MNICVGGVQARFLRSEDFPSCANLIPSPSAISNKLLSLRTLLLLLYWCLFTLDIGGFFLEPIQTNWKKIARVLAVQDMGGFPPSVLHYIRAPLVPPSKIKSCMKLWVTHTSVFTFANYYLPKKQFQPDVKLYPCFSSVVWYKMDAWGCPLAVK